MKNYLIIGASSGIGKQLAIQLAANGDNVFATYYRNKLEGYSPNIEWHYLNVLEDKPLLEFLPDNLDGFAYCPGSIILKPFYSLKPEEFIEDYQLQVIGLMKVLQAIMPKLKNAGSASVVLFSSVAVDTGFNFHSLVSSTKGAIQGITKALAAEFAPHVRFNCIAPSITDTTLASPYLNTDVKMKMNVNRHPLKRIGKVEDIADLAAFLLSEKSSWITAQVIHADGGIGSIN